jgi:FAD/FMN-containing dehydrogenase
VAIAAGIEGFAGEIVRPSDPGYEEARTVWNAMIDRRPAMVVRPSDTRDVAAAVRHARACGLAVSIRCGGHSIPGHSVCDGGIVVDLSHMRRVEVDPTARRVRAQGGCLLSTLDAATQEHGLCVPAGAVSHTGLGGLVLGGGFGHLMRKHGLSIDNLVGAQVVLADGEVVRADEDHHPDLFWALRGGGGNFGIVTEFEFRCYERGPVFASTSIFPLDRARPVLDRWRAVMADAPDELVWMANFRIAPPLDWVPAELQLQPVLVAPMVWAGDADEGEVFVTSLAGELEGAVATERAAVPYTVLQSGSDAVFAHGRQNFHKAAFLRELDDSALDALLERARSVPSKWTMVEVVRLGGAIARVPSDATAFAHRSAPWSLNIIGMWERPDEDPPNIAWVRETYTALQPSMTGGAYVNYMSGDEVGGAMAAYGATWDRLTSVKARYDPDNVFSLNQNITPRAARAA